jgi:hypothetical protein
MFWLLQLRMWLQAWWLRLFTPEKSYYIVTLESGDGHRWQVPVRATDYEDAFHYAVQHYPTEIVIDVQLQG